MIMVLHQKVNLKDHHGPFGGTMPKYNNKYAIFLDELRNSYNITEDDFCENICDPRSYRRYLSGERNLTHQKIESFCEKLNISLNDFFYSAVEHDRIEFQKVNHLHQMIAHRDYDLFYKSAKDVNPKYFNNDQNKRFLKFCYLRADYKTNRIHPYEAHNELSALIDYPECLKRTAFDYLDIISLTTIAAIEVDANKRLALNKLLEILSDNSLRYLSSESRYLMPSVYGSVAIFLKNLKEYETAIELCKKGIEYSNIYQVSDTLAYLHYVMGHSLLQMGRKKEAEYHAIKSLMTVFIKDEINHIKLFHSTIVEEFNYDPLDYLKEHKDKLLKKDSD